MKLKLILTTATVGVALALPSMASAAPSPTQDSVALTGGVGSVHTTITLPPPNGTIPATIRIFDLNATSGPSGENPSGLVSFEFDTAVADLPFDGPVTCLAVSGNSAILNFRPPVGRPFGGSIVTVQVLDNQPDTFIFGLTDRAPTDCSPFTSPGLPLSFGDITVVDAQATPTTINQCKNGGWRNFPQFKNQGQCIAFVNHGS
jgi:hypothetical protein